MKQQHSNGDVKPEASKYLKRKIAVRRLHHFRAGRAAHEYQAACAGRNNEILQLSTR